MKTIPYRRKREGKTDYKKRLSLLKSNKLRLVVRTSNKHTLLQLAQYTPKGDEIVVSASTAELAKLGWTTSTSNLPAAYLAGFLLAKKAKVKESVPDIGMHASVKGARIYAALKGCKDGGLIFSLDASVAPPEERITGKHTKSKADITTMKKKIEETTWQKK